MTERAQLRAFLGRALPEQVSLVTRGLSLRALSGVVQMTPVDTGRARGGWTVTLGSPSGRDPGVLDKSGGQAISAGSATIAKQRAYQQVVLENNVPYIGRLEDGYSKQAPGGMAAITLAALGLGTDRDD